MTNEVESIPRTSEQCCAPILAKLQQVANESPRDVIASAITHHFFVPGVTYLSASSGRIVMRHFDAKSSVEPANSVSRIFFLSALV